MHQKIFITVFFLLLLAPFAAMLFYETDMSVEKRHAQAFPEIVEDGSVNLEFFQQLTDYMADHYAFRQEMVTLDAQMKKDLFHVSNNEQVIVGKDGWLFFADSMDDYKMRDTMGKRDIRNCAKILALLQEAAESRDARFVFAVAPNKNELYKQYMPDRIRQEGEVGNLSLLTEELKRQGVHYVDLRKTLAGQEREVYHKLDTHWNNEGAAIACDAILNSFGKAHYDYHNEPYQVVRNFSGDLQEMLMPKGRTLDENVIYDRSNVFSYVGETDSVEDMFIETQSEQGQGCLLAFRDSFGNALLPFLANEYASAYFTKSVPYDLSLMDVNEVDNVVLEIVQRNIPTLTDGIPYVMAPYREFDGEVEVAEKTTASMYDEDLGDCYLIYGELDPALMDNDSDIYICFNGEETCYMFEAFPAVCEYFPEDGVDRSACYGLYVEKSALDDEEYEVEIITDKAGMYYSSGILQKYKGG